MTCLLPGSIHDDRFAMVDSETAQSMSTALHRYLCQHDCGWMLLDAGLHLRDTISMQCVGHWFLIVLAN